MNDPRREAESGANFESPSDESVDEYHGIIVQEGLRDPSALDTVTVLGETRGRVWRLLRVGVPERLLPTAIAKMQATLKVEGGVPFYVHFYRRDELVVVFPDRVFRATPRKETWAPMLAYRRAVGIPDGQLDFAPCRFEDETY
jgi:hypothetical protein